MKEPDLDSLEKDLHRLRPAASEEFVNRLVACRPPRSEAREPMRRANFFEQMRMPLDRIGFWLRWCAAPAALVCIIGIVWFRPEPPPTLVDASGTNRAQQLTEIPAGVGQVEIEHDLVDSYEMVADSPAGVPVRFRLDKWRDTVVYRDPRTGLAVERRSPRFEVVPISLETY